MTKNREWKGPTGVVPPGIAYRKLTDDAWEHAQIIIKGHIGSQPPAEFRGALNTALHVWQDSKCLQKEESPKSVRSNLKLAHDAARRQIYRLNELGGNSRQLLGEIDGGGILELYRLAEAIERQLAQVLEIADELPTTRSGQRDFPALNMGLYLADGMKRHLGQQATSTDTGLFAQLYAVLAKEVGISSDGKAIRAAIRYIKEDRQHY